MKRELKINHKILEAMKKPQPIIVIIGGRGSGKSLGMGDWSVFEMDTKGYDIYCLREFQDSLSDSVHKVFKSSINDRLKLEGWDIQQNTVIAPNGASTTYKGANRNPDAMQSAQGYLRSWFEEAHRASQDSIDKLLPTIIRNPGAKCIFTANPQSSEDAFSKRFITPYQDALDRDGFYEDELHYIVVVNWRDNPWWNEEQEVLRKWDYENMPRAKYDWVWEGKFNDSVEHALIDAEWFDACIDAHEKLGFEARGVKIAAHDPSDLGPDSKGYAMRHGSVVLDVQEKTEGSVNEGARWAADIAIQQNIDLFTWDGDGMGLGLGEQFSSDFEGKHSQVSMFRGSEGVDHPNSIYKPAQKGIISDQRSNKDTFRNKRAQYYFDLRDRVYSTYRSVKFQVATDPDKMISFSSDIGLLKKLRAELCRMPIKPNGNGLFELYTKAEMKHKFKIASPNLGDSVMMLMRAARTAKRKSLNIPRVSIV